MKQAEVIETETGLSVSGKIGFDNVVALRRQGNRVINHIMQRQLTVDLSEVTSSDSSALSLLLRWLGYAGQQGKTMSFINIPLPLYKVAKVYGVASLLEISISEDRRQKTEDRGRGIEWIN